MPTKHLSRAVHNQPTQHPRYHRYPPTASRQSHNETHNFPHRRYRPAITRPPTPRQAPNASRTRQMLHTTIKTPTRPTTRHHHIRKPRLKRRPQKGKRPKPRRARNRQRDPTTSPKQFTRPNATQSGANLISRRHRYLNQERNFRPTTKGPTQRNTAS